MTAYWLTYKRRTAASPGGMDDWAIQDIAERFKDDPDKAIERWRFASYRSAKAGDSAYFFKQGAEPRGIFGVGKILQIIQPNAEEGKGPGAQIKIERLVDPTREQLLLPLDAFSDQFRPGLINAQASGNALTESESLLIESLLKAPQDRVHPDLGAEDADERPFDPNKIEDHREESLRAIKVRRGQQAFRRVLLEAYDRRCAITGCDVMDVLEAAQLSPYLGSETNDVTNGIILRSDIHVLFDVHLLSFDPEKLTVVISNRLVKSSYAVLAGKLISLPNEHAFRPSVLSLRQHFRCFQKKGP